MEMRWTPPRVDLHWVAAFLLGHRVWGQSHLHPRSRETRHLSTLDVV